MKNLLFLLFATLNHMILFCYHGKAFFSNYVYKFKVKISKQSYVNFKRSELEKSYIEIRGQDNHIICSDALVRDSSIMINGTNNKVVINPGVKLRKANIQVRGTNCTVEIGERTSFGQIRIVNVGKNNKISIGAGCLFADDIEIWASDTHSIFDESGKFINPEKPVIIHDKVWVGSHVRILKGVTINKGAIIGMNSVITKDIESKVLCAGNPIRILKSNITWALDYPEN